MRHQSFAVAAVWRWGRFGGLGAVLLASVLSSGLRAQDLPAAGSPPAQSQSFASLIGTVRDPLGAAVPGVAVMLIGQNDTVNRTVVADGAGAFLFGGLASGTYRVEVSAPGLAPSVSAPVVLAAGERRELAVAAPQLPVQNTTVNVVATLNQVAQAQVKQQEQQRVLGVFPNYYTSYIWNAAPMSQKLKFNLALRTAGDPITFLVVGIVAGVEQAHKTFPGYGQGAEGYAKRYGAAYADTIGSRMLGSAILPVIFHQDPRYFYRGSGSTRSRIAHALASTVICKGDNGRLEPNYSHVLGSFAAAGLSNVYRASGDRQAGLTFRNGLIVLGGSAVENLLREFLSRKLTPNVPTFANGKP